MKNVLDAIEKYNGIINDFIWGPPLIILLIGIGIYLSIRLNFVQVVNIKDIIENMKRKEKKKAPGEISSFKAFMVGLGGIVGSGNIAGIATAIASGGPGALVWMWIAAFFGMATKFSEITLGILYRKKNKDNSYSGGPMYYLRDGVKSKFLAALYAILVIFSYIVIVAMVDTNTIVSTITAKFNISSFILGIFLVIIVGTIIFGGIKKIGNFSAKIVPFMGIFYIFTCLLVILFNFDKVGEAFGIIFTSAFKPAAAIGGFAGATVMEVVRYGFARGIYSNEAGLGTAAITHSSAKVSHPIQQALWGPVEVFVDTIIINTMTGLVVVISGSWISGETGAPLVMTAFDSILPGNIGGYLIMISSVLFSFTCLTSSSFICEQAAKYLFGEKGKNIIKIFWLIFIMIGAVTSLELVWNLADTVNGFVAIPSIIGLFILSNKVIKCKKEYLKK